MSKNIGNKTSEHNSLPHARASFILYAVGISVWMTLVSCLGSTYMHPLLPNDASAVPYVIAQQTSYVLAYFAFFILEWRGKLSHPRSFLVITAITLGSSTLCLVCIMVGIDHPSLYPVYGIFTGIGITSGYMQWIRIVAQRQQKEILTLLFIASAVSIISGVLFAFVSTIVRSIVFIALAIISIAFMYVNTANTSFTCLAYNHAANPATSRRLAMELVLPIVCAVALVLVAPIASTTYIDYAGQDLFRTLLAQAANALMLGVLAVFYFALKRYVRIFDVYCALLPILASSVLVAAFFEPQQRWFVLFLGDMCFCAVSFLTLLSTCHIAKRLMIPATIVYGLLGGFVYLARLPEILLAFNPDALAGSPAPFAIAALLLYLLAMPAFFLPFLTKKAKADWSHLEKSYTTDDISAACNSLAIENRIPPRQAEVLNMLAAGHSIAHIADKLCLSENTVKTYRKSIYAALNVHSRQALLDLVHDEMKR